VTLRAAPVMTAAIPFASDDRLPRARVVGLRTPGHAFLFLHHPWRDILVVLDFASRARAYCCEGRVAQWIEHQPSKLRVAGSSPAALTISGEAYAQKRSHVPSPAACTSAHLCSAGWDLVPITPEGTRPVLREAHMTRFTKMFAAVSGAVGIGLVGVSAFLTLPASTTQAGTYEVAQINPDQMTRNAPRELPSFEQNYQMHIGVLDTLRR
jgi:hypothetical protein